MVLSTMQKNAVDLIEDWFLRSSEQEFVLAGYAGTGKTYMINSAVERLVDAGAIKLHEIVYGTFTGKASLVLTQKLSEGTYCYTLHKILYKVDEVGGRTIFVPRYNENNKPPFKLLIIDECSMVSAELLKDIRALGVKVLYVGDHGQLPPVGKKSDIYARLTESPNAVLTEIHRQAEGNPIIHLSMLAREKKTIQLGKYGDNVKVVSKGEINSRYWNSLMNADQVICGLNKTRDYLNIRMRQSLDIHSDVPVIGDKMIVLKNDWDKGTTEIPFVNGLIGTLESVSELNLKINKTIWKYRRPKIYTYVDKRKALKLSFKPEMSEDDVFTDIHVLKGDITGANHVDDDYKHYNCMDFGYAITCHKSQGSEWDKVFVVNEVLRAEDHHRWLYTAVTRASKALMVAF